MEASSIKLGSVRMLNEALKMLWVNDMQYLY